MLSKLLLLFLVILISCDTVLDKACNCSQIQNETDCKRILCKYENGQCKEREQETYCKLASTIAQCPVRGCALYENVCQAFAGCTAYLGKTFDACNKISDLCTSDGERCVPLSTCDTYLTKTSCYIDNTNQYCYYDESDAANPKCKTVAACKNLPIALKTNQQCRSSISTCTVNETNSGCVDSGKNCSDQKIKSQCVTNLDQTMECKWNETTSTCYDYTCVNGNGKTVDECQKYKETCVLAETQDGTSSTCKDIDECVNYKFMDTCKIGIQGNCLWLVTQVDGKDVGKCVDYNCSQASDDYINDQLCLKFLASCTIDDDGLGCKMREAECSSYSQVSQCVSTIDGNQCYWNKSKQICVSYNCDNAQVDTYTSENCNKFLSICTANVGQTQCVKKQCTDALTSQLCTKLGSCIWQDNKCVSFTCANAPTTLTTNTACSNFLDKCYTTGAGCSSNGTCTDMKTEAACKTDSQNKKCIWLSSACKVKTCSDLVYYSHSECNDQLDTCTSDGTKCITQAVKCSDYKLSLSCVISIEGPCLWIDSQCFLFQDCTSLSGTTHQFCNLANSNCTTDGTKCVPITSCAKTLQTGCYVGTDGDCVRNLDKSNNTICEKFTKCTQMNFTTHFQCFREKKTCTVNSDKKTCMDLSSACSNYTIQDKLFVNGIQQHQNAEIKNALIQQRQLMGTVNQQMLNVQLILANVLISKNVMVTLLVIYANMDQMALVFLTQLKVCTDITDVKQCTTLANCLADTSSCVAKSTCASYKTENSCGFDGTDGVCTWNNSTCSVMTKCEDANSFEKGCKKKSEICKWTPKPSNGGSSSCKPYTCQSKNSGSTCLPLVAFSETEYQVCAEIQLTCQSASISDLTEDTCFINSAKSHYWDKTTNKCLACNGTTVTNTTVIDSSYSWMIGTIYLYIAFVQF
ncbi:unnamed protein product (macronuclear) [Paramecium tetraurelia]|uniref:Mini antigen n=1 Tax=Paramecium tetraurelia TaxID=5888 RepID=A0DD22_PARTE|nr:uncharacterized protein GSPATT00015798001 [Paramecium tetraurelia]CAK80939.1 unnamed protein product [Paramecium tetraurelia]|eukprot:XP_001448336.1 hypothetical protein (macronuclear) [Paramecium tetraurelia strain d4-2]